MCAPLRAYADLADQSARGTWTDAGLRIASVWLILATCLTISSTGHLSAPAFVSVLAWWAIVPLFQLLTALAMVRGPGLSAIGRARGVDLFLVGHGPWSLWLIAFATWAAFIQKAGSWLLLVEFSVVVPAAWTTVIVFGYCCAVLRLDRRAASRRLLLYLGLTWGAILVFWGSAVQLWPRVLEWFA